MTASVLEILDIKSSDKIIAIKETSTADATFILTSFMYHTFNNQRNLCFIAFHNTFNHYYQIGKKFGFDLKAETQKGHVKVIEVLKEINDELIVENKLFLLEDKAEIVKQLFKRIDSTIVELQKNGNSTTIIIDDVSHLLDLGIDLRHICAFLRYLFVLTVSKSVFLVINCHYVSNIEDIISNLIFHSADITITISALKTGESRQVSGIMHINNKDQNSTNSEKVYHYKLFDSDVKIFTPGTALL